MEDLFLTWEAPVELGCIFWSSPQISCTLGIAGHADAALFLKHPWRHLGWWRSSLATAPLQRLPALLLHSYLPGWDGQCPSSSPKWCQAEGNHSPWTENGPFSSAPDGEQMATASISSDGSSAVMRDQHCKEMSAKPGGEKKGRLRIDPRSAKSLRFMSHIPMVKAGPHGVRGWWGAICCPMACTIDGPDQRNIL